MGSNIDVEEINVFNLVDDTVVVIVNIDGICNAVSISIGRKLRNFSNFQTEILR